VRGIIVRHGHAHQLFWRTCGSGARPGTSIVEDEHPTAFFGTGAGRWLAPSAWVWDATGGQTPPVIFPWALSAKHNAF